MASLARRFLCAELCRGERGCAVCVHRTGAPRAVLPASLVRPAERCALCSAAVAVTGKRFVPSAARPWIPSRQYWWVKVKHVISKRK